MTISSANNNNRTSPKIDEEIDEIDNAVYKVFTKIKNYDANVDTDVDLRPFYELIYGLAFSLEDTVQLGMQVFDNIDVNIVNKIIQSARNRAYLMHKNIERIYQLEKEIDEQREQGNNKLADMLCKELEGSKKEGR